MEQSWRQGAEDKYVRAKYISTPALGIRTEKQDVRDKARPDERRETSVGRPTNSGPKGLHSPLGPKFTLTPNLSVFVLRVWSTNGHNATNSKASTLLCQIWGYSC